MCIEDEKYKSFEDSLKKFIAKEKSLRNSDMVFDETIIIII